MGVSYCERDDLEAGSPVQKLKPHFAAELENECVPEERPINCAGDEDAAAGFKPPTSSIKTPG